MPCDVIDLPDRGDEPKQPIFAEFTLPRSYPTERFQFIADWNDVMGKWVFRLVWVGEGTIITRTPAHRRYPYHDEDVPDRLTLLFLDPTGAEPDVTAENLGNEVHLTIWPGPLAPEYDPSARTPAGDPEWYPLLVPDSEADRERKERYDSPTAPASAVSAYDAAVYDDSSYR